MYDVCIAEIYRAATLVANNSMCLVFIASTQQAPENYVGKDVWLWSFKVIEINSSM